MNRGTELSDGSLRTDSRGVSEALGYALIFSLVVATIALILGTGLAGLEDVREREQAENAERAFDVLAENMAAVYERNSPSRSTEIDLHDASLRYGEQTTINVSVSEDGQDFTHHEFETRPLEYHISSDRSLVYEGGAVFRTEGEGGVVLRDPPFLISDDRFHVPLVETTTREQRAVSGTTVLVRGESTDRAILESENQNPYDELRITVTSPRYDLWDRYLDSQPSTQCDASPQSESVECIVDTDPDVVYVTFTQVRLSIDT